MSLESRRDDYEEKGRREGIAQGIAQGIVETGKECGLSDAAIVQRLQKKLGLSIANARSYLEQFGGEVYEFGEQRSRNKPCRFWRK